MRQIIWHSPGRPWTQAQVDVLGAWLRAHDIDPGTVHHDMVISTGFGSEQEATPQLHVSVYQTNEHGQRYGDLAAGTVRAVTLPLVVPLLYAPPFADSRLDPDAGVATEYQLTEHDTARIHTLRAVLCEPNGRAVRVGPDVIAGLPLPARLTHDKDGPYVEVDLSGLPDTDPRVRYRRRYDGADLGHLVLAG
jgi:hypothetical protein